MHVEVSVALNFVISYLYNKLPRRRVDMFAEELERGLKDKFDGHWYPEQPAKGSAYRCLRIGEKVDPLITNAMQMSGLVLAEIRDFLPADLTIWIDPNEVSHRVGERGPVKILYSHRGSPVADPDEVVADREIQTVTVNGDIDSPTSGLNTLTFNPEAQSFRPIETLSASLTNLSLSPSSPGGMPAWRSACASPSAGIPGSSSPAGFLANNTARPAIPTTFTAASFAQTKFGSTKLKSQAKRPSRLSPTEFIGYSSKSPQSRSPGSAAPSWSGAMSPVRPQSLSPRDPRLDFIEHQQRMLFLQQQQQQQQHLVLQNAGLMAAGLGGSLGDLHHARQLPVNFTDLLTLSPTQQVAHQSIGAATVAPVVLSADDGAGKAYLDTSAVNWNSLPACAALQHMLVAN